MRPKALRRHGVIFVFGNIEISCVLGFQSALFGDMSDPISAIGHHPVSSPHTSGPAPRPALQRPEEGVEQRAGLPGVPVVVRRV